MCSLTNLKRTWTFLLVALSICGCSKNIQTTQPTDDLEEVESKLKFILPNGWSVTREGNVFQLTRSEKLWVYNLMQQDLRTQDEWSEWVKEHGIKLTYQITLRFEPLIPRQQYEQMKRERAPYEKIVNEGARTIDEWQRGAYEFSRRTIPIYFTDRYTIYAEKSDVYPHRVYPASAASECNQVIASLDKLFTRYDPVSGKSSDFQVR